MPNENGRVVRWNQMEIGEARSFAQGSLKLGSRLALALADRLDRFTTAVVAVPAELTGRELSPDHVGRGFPHSLMRTAAAMRIMESMRASGSSLVVEDDLMRQGDPARLPSAYVDDRVLHWCEPSADSESVETLLRLGSSGYPLNAYLCDIDLVPSGRVADSTLHRAASSVHTLVVAVFDAESFLVLTADRWQYSPAVGEWAGFSAG